MSPLPLRSDLPRPAPSTDEDRPIDEACQHFDACDDLGEQREWPGWTCARCGIYQTTHPEITPGEPRPEDPMTKKTTPAESPAITHESTLYAVARAIGRANSYVYNVASRLGISREQRTPAQHEQLMAELGAHPPRQSPTRSPTVETTTGPALDPSSPPASTTLTIEQVAAMPPEDGVARRRELELVTAKLAGRAVYKRGLIAAVERRITGLSARIDELEGLLRLLSGDDVSSADLEGQG